MSVYNRLDKLEVIIAVGFRFLDKTDGGYYIDE